MSPMDATDYDRIQQIVDKATARVEAQVRLMMPKDESLSRHLATADRVSSVEKRQAEIAESLTKVMTWAMGEHEKIRAATDGRFDHMEQNVDKRFDEVEASINELKQSLSDSKSTTIRYMVSVIVSFIVGGGLLGIIEFILTRH